MNRLFGALEQQIEFIRNGGNVKRYHTKHVIHENTVAHHSFGVAYLAYLLSDMEPSVNLLMACLSHDLSEQITGDVSSPTKRRFPELAAMIQTMETEELENHELNFEAFLTDEEKKILKLADCLDGMLYCIGEMELGNKSIFEVYNRYNKYILQLDPQDTQLDVLRAVLALGVPYV